MLDIILIQHIKAGINLLEFSHIDTKFKKEHSEIFGGFMSAIQGITKELNIGQVVLISTRGDKGHNCIITHRPPINIIILADQNDPIELWREQGELIADEFINQYGTSFNPSMVAKFKNFNAFLEKLCAGYEYCDESS